MIRYAVVSDVHGNRWALDAVLQDARRRGADVLLNLGDAVYGPLDPSGTAALLRDAGLSSRHIRGNEDRVIYESDADASLHGSLKFTRGALSEGDVAWLRSLAPHATVADVRLCHGTPESDEVYLLEQVTEHGVALRDRESLATLVRGVTERVLLCGHTHIPRLIQLDALVIVNPGSVGLPAYSDVRPHPHRMETGSPHARYAIVSVGTTVSVDLIGVAYDWDTAARVASKNGRPDWAEALRTGRAV
ncbi:metallophosphatase family protein [Pendulispora rubella]|uniref:Metallophosphatase family protein n=1 Tax=Pendulispora rubella TaxID=2741070 RepID=A0ABZ2KYK2_9BACT